MKKLIDAFVFAIKGLHYAFLHERNFKIEICCAVAFCMAGFALQISTREWLLVIMNIGFVLTAELINTAIEKLCNAITKEQHPTIKIVKDVAAAAVLVAAFVAFICALIIFVPAFLKLIDQ